MTRLTVAVVVPALDEEGNIASVVEDTLAQEVDWVLVVDNGSTDSTATTAALAGAIVVEEPRRGYGYACAAGSEAALDRSADIVAYVDGDGSSPPDELPEVLAPIISGDADLVLGSRALGSVEAGSMGPHQRWGNRFAAWLTRHRYRVDVTDLGPFRAIRADVLAGLDMREMTFGWPTEMTVKCARAGRRIMEVPVSWRGRRTG
ncbi:MAG: glycosyltransferase family 2 protein, partial [Ilumatobacteraceae bacterium]